MEQSLQILSDVSIKGYNTFGVAASAQHLLEVSDEIVLLNSLYELRSFKLPFLPIGGGSNLLITNDLEGIVLLNRIKGIRCIEERHSEVIIEVGGGVIWHDLVNYCVERNWGGIENLALIPGTVGAAPIQNIGAYGVELEQVFEELTAIDLETGELCRFSHEDCQFGYRNSVFKYEQPKRFFIVRVRLRLLKNAPLRLSYGRLRETVERMVREENCSLNIATVSEAVCRIRRSKLPDPSVLGNSGSFFKNPVLDAKDFEAFSKQHANAPFYALGDGSYKVPAAWLIEQAGFKGYRSTESDAGVYEQHALILVNHGNASGNELLTLSKRLQATVREKFGITIAPEVTIW